MAVIKRLIGREVLDSSGRPTVQGMCELSSGAIGIASVPSEVTTRTSSTIALRDGNPFRYNGLGCLRAASHISNEMHNALSGHTFERQSDLDAAMISLDGSPNKERLGANALLAVSVAFARAVAIERHVPLYKHFADIAEQSLQTLPNLAINLFTGISFTDMQFPIQNLMLIPMSAHTIRDELAITSDVYQMASELVNRKYNMPALTADDGGLAPAFVDTMTMFSDVLESIRATEWMPAGDFIIALDVAANRFYHNSSYYFEKQILDSKEMIEHIHHLIASYPIVSIEDGLAKEDWVHWSDLYAKIGAEVLVVGDDLLGSNPTRIQRAIDEQAANALLLKVSQVGTLSEARDAYALARSAGWTVIIGTPSGETEDDWVADLAVGWSANQVEFGSITHSERLCKYNRLMAIEEETGLPLAYWCED